MMTTLNKIQVPQTGTYRIDPAKSEITFEAKHLFGLGTVRGSFQLESASLQVETGVERSTAKATVDATSYASGSSLRDKQVRGKRFLNTDEFPEINFVSTGVQRVDDTWVLDGSLTVRGRSGPISVAVVDSVARDDALTLVATTRIDRYAFGIKASRGMAGRHLDLTLHLTAHAEH
ncbi:MAG TPA: YceI family protein [Sporichthyaceae bacterium]|jgi:polyisoprenoid-binding protein YceI|nr:YceI family protein [Sporichthyaceae bacterium]